MSPFERDPVCGLIFVYPRCGYNNYLLWPTLTNRTPNPTGRCAANFARKATPNRSVVSPTQASPHPANATAQPAHYPPRRAARPGHLPNPAGTASAPTTLPAHLCSPPRYIRPWSLPPRRQAARVAGNGWAGQRDGAHWDYFGGVLLLSPG